MRLCCKKKKNVRKLPNYCYSFSLQRFLRVNPLPITAMKATKLSMLKMALPTDMEMAIPERLATANMDKAKKTILIFKSITLQSYFPLYTK
jgi:hypothetical protein